MASGKAVGFEVTRSSQQIGKLHRLVTTHTGDWRFTAKIAIGKILHDLIMKPIFVIKHIMRNAKTSGNRAGVMDINTSTARALGLYRNPMIIELQGNANHIEPLLMKQGGRYR